MSQLSNDSNYDVPQTGTITALNGTFLLDPIQKDTQALSLTGTWIGTVTFEASNDGSTWFPIKGFNVSNYVVSATASSNGNFVIPTAGYSQTRVVASAFTSGTIILANEGSASTQAVFAMQPNADSLLATALLKGGTDNTTVGNTGDRLKVDANFSVLGGQLVPTITNKFRVRYSTTPATVGSAYSTIFTRSGTGLFFGFQADFNSANVRLRCTIDSGQIFEITVADLKLFQFNDTTTTRMQMGGFWATVGNTVDFSSKFPIPYTTSITIEMQRSDGTNHQMSQYMMLLTEDT